MEKEIFKLTGTVEEISDVIQIRRLQKPDLFKKVITIKSFETNQILYPEIRNTALKSLENEGIEIGSLVEITFIFQGTEKDGKKYNNVLIQTIKRLA
jgi:hypothetical protein